LDQPRLLASLRPIQSTHRTIDSDRLIIEATSVDRADPD
jgi:hypothetical protein